MFCIFSHIYRNFYKNLSHNISRAQVKNWYTEEDIPVGYICILSFALYFFCLHFVKFTFCPGYMIPKSHLMCYPWWKYCSIVILLRYRGSWERLGSTFLAKTLEIFRKNFPNLEHFSVKILLMHGRKYVFTVYIIKILSSFQKALLESDLYVCIGNGNTRV